MRKVDDELAFLAAHPEIGVYTARDVYRRSVESVAEDVTAQLRDVDAVYITCASGRLFCQGAAYHRLRSARHERRIYPALLPVCHSERP